MPVQDNDGGITAELLSRHGNSAQPESQQLVAVLHALRDVITAEQMPITPTSFFAASMSALEKPETRSSPQVTLAMCTLLGHVLPRVPNAVLRAKWVGATSLIIAILREHQQQAPVVKAGLVVLAQLLGALDPSPEAWPAAAGPWATLLSFLTESRAKVRKRAVGGVLEVLGALQAHTSALTSASDALAKLATSVLSGPEAAARAAAAASNKARPAAEDAIAQAVSDALHLLGALKAALPLMAGAPTKVVVDQLFQLLPLRQPLLTRHTADALTALVSASTTHLPAATLAELMQVVMDAGDVLWDRRDPDLMLQLTRLLEGGCLQLSSTSPQLAAARLPRIVHALVPQLGAPQEGVRHGTSMALRNLMQGCVSQDMVAGALQGAEARAAQPPLISVVAALASSLSARYQEGWALAIPVVGELIEVLGQRLSGQAAARTGAVAQMSAPLLRPLAAMISGEEDAQEGAAMGDQGQASSDVVEAASTALGAALRALGPHVVLSVLPLNIKEQLAGKSNAPEPRTWLLPLLRRHVAGTTLEYWGGELLPLARGLAAQSQAAAAAGQSTLANSCHVLELQVWATLPAFVSWATDLPTAFSIYAKDMAGAFNARPDLRGWVCAGLERAALQARQVLRTSPAHQHMTGYSEPLGSHGDGEEDDDEEYGAKPSRPARSMASVRRGGRGGHGGAEGGQHHNTPPASYTVDTAVGAVEALRALSKNWLSVMCKSFLAASPGQRGSLASCISAYAAISDPTVVAGLFRTSITRLLKIMSDEANNAPLSEHITDGGTTPSERRSAFTELALCLASGLPDEGLDTLLKAAKPSLLELKDPALQKKGYKVVAYLTECRPAFLRAHIAELLELVVGGATTSVSASKRYRLRCLKPLIILLAGKESLPEGALPALPGINDGADEDEMAGSSDSDDEGRGRRPGSKAQARTGGDSSDQKRKEVISVLVSELMLCCKESNKKTRAAAYELLVQIAHAMDEIDPVVQADDSDEGMEGEGGSGMPTGGLATLFSMIMAGLAGQTPHMISASVMALARLLYEFAGDLQPLVPQLLPAVLLLLRTKSREVVKAVLGFMKVCAIRMPVDLLTNNLGDMLEGMLLWASDSKNKFRQKIRVIVERLARRCGFDAVAQHIPESDARLLTHIRKEHNKKMRRKAGSQAGDDDDEEEGDGRSQKSAGQSSRARTARASEWGHTAIFSDDDDDDDGDEEGQTRGARSVKSGKQAGGARTVAGRSKQAGSRGAAAGGGARLAEREDEPMDLLDMSAARHLVKSAAGGRREGRARAEDDYTRDPEGRMMIRDEEAEERRRAAKRKRRGDDDYDSEDSDFEDLTGVAGLDAAVRSANKSAAVQRAMSIKSGGGKSLGGKSGGGMSVGGRSKSGASTKKGPSLHSGDRFKAKSTTGGDVKGRSKVDPYAYWQFDRKMLNQRKAKQRQASKSLGNVLTTARTGTVRGGKAKLRAQNKKARHDE